MEERKLCWVKFRLACEFVDEHHRTHDRPQGHVLSIGCKVGNQLIGVAMLGRPVSREADDGSELELIRFCIIEGHRNTASWLMARARRLAHAMGCTLRTYSFPSEGGASMRAAGLIYDGDTKPATKGWTCTSRPRKKKGTEGKKHRWRIL